MNRAPLVFAIAIAALTAALVFAQDATERKLALTAGASLRYPQSWSPGAIRYQNASEIVTPPPEASRGVAQARILITTEQRRDHTEAVRRLGEIAHEWNGPAKVLEIGGWPAIRVQFEAPLPRTGAEGAQPSGPPQISTRVTTAVAAAGLVLRMDAVLAPGADAKLVNEVDAIAHTATFESTGQPSEIENDLENLKKMLATQPARGGIETTPASRSSRSGPMKAVTGSDVTVQNGFGELEVAASNNGQNVVVAANSGHSSSGDGGTTFTFRGGTPSPFPADGDPSLGVGASGDFYYGFIGFPNGTSAALNVSGCSTGISVSTDGGVTFPFKNHAVLCPNSGAGICFPDQPHITADRINTAPGGDQIYSTWRNFTPAGAASSCSFGSGYVTPSLVCSANGGTSWTTPPTVVGAGDFPRITAGSDGFVYVTYRSGANGMLNKFSSCNAGLAQQAGFPAVIAAFNDVICPVPGLDRCNDGNSLSSHTVAVDDVTPNHLYAAYATNTASGNEDVIVRESVDGGSTWSANITVNSSISGRRFMPWVCSTGGAAFVSWYDRRAASAAQNDLTDYYVGGAVVRSGALLQGGEQNLTTNSDRQCASGFPCGARSPNDYNSCSPPATGTAGGGCPKYGDYNGGTCISSRVYNAWASATAPPGLPAVTGITVFSGTTALSDFYVRDWTDSPSSGDNGAQPSSHSDFYTTSDVWNRRGTLPGTPFPNDQPVNEDAGNGSGNIGDNWAFARIRRNAAPSSGSASVTAHFLVSKFGTGSNFVDSGSADPDVALDPNDPTVTFNAGDLGPLITPAYHWHLNSISGNHLCLAVEISALGDPYLTPSLVGQSPGSSAVETRVVDDNNKAQRNMGLSTTPARGTGGAAGAYCAIVHNAATLSRDITLRYEAQPDVLTRLRDVKIDMVGGPQRHATETLTLSERAGRLTFKNMSPGENRWVCMNFKVSPGEEEHILPVNFSELNGDKVVNGFAMGARLASMRGVANDAVRLHASVFRRMDLLFKAAGSAEQAGAAWKIAETKESERDYLLFLKSHIDSIQRTVNGFVSSDHSNDPFGVLQSAAELKTEIASGNEDTIAAAHAAFLERLDSFLTMRQLARGDPADTLQMVKWQRELYSVVAELRDLPSAKYVVQQSDAFIADVQQRKRRGDTYPQLVRGLMMSFHGTAEVLERTGLHLEPEVAALQEHLDSLAALQSAHRAFLLKLNRLRK